MSTAAVLPFLKNLLAPPTPLPGPDNAPPPEAPQIQSGPMDASAENMANVANAPVGPVMGGESKGHKLLRILQGGLAGGLAGYAQNAQTYAQTGRNAGFGGGFEGAFQLPFTQAYQRGQLAQQQAQTEMLKAQAQMVNTPYGPIPGWLAKAVIPSEVRAGATTQAAQTRAGATTQAAKIGADARLRAAQMGLGPVAQVPQDLQDQFGLPAELPLKMLNQAESAANKPLTIVQGANDAYKVNKQTNQKTPLGVGSGRIAAIMARPTEVADPNNPGNTVMVTGGQSIGMQGKSGAGTQTAKAVAKSEVPTGAGNQRLAFNTALAHADLLTAAIRALDNGDEQTLNGLRNRFKAEFGASGPVTAGVIADAYSKEVQKGLSGGHITEGDQKNIASTLNVNKQSMGQALDAVNAYKQLFASKVRNLDTQEQGAIQRAQPKGKGQKAASDPLGIR